VRTESAVPVETEKARPCFIEHEGRYLFIWHHPAQPTLRRGSAVVLCPPLGSDYICAYRVWRKLAERLAAAGFDVLRFDYEGTGDSAGDLEEPERVQAWIRNIGRVAAEARQLAGASDVTLVGLRIGATLALHAAVALGGVNRLVLWSPFRSGRAYVRELKAFSRLSRKDYVTQTDQGPDILASGYVLPGPVAQALEGLDIDAISIPPACRVLLVDRDDRPADPKLRERLEALGSCVAYVRPVGTAAMLEQAALAYVPDAALDAITEWLEGSTSSDGRVGAVMERADRSSLAQGAGYHERGVRFGGADRLFGILTVPDDTSGGAPVVILLNTGFEYRVGPHRLYVPLARELAAQGHVVFRYDLGGIGDSAPPSGAKENVPYPAHALDDLRQAIACVRKEAPGRRLIVAGLCSGGWHAFSAGREGLPIDGIVAVNAPLYLCDGLSWTATRSTEYAEGLTYRRKLRDATRWASALRGRTNYRHLARFVATYLARRVADRTRAVFGGWKEDGLSRDLERVSARGITSLFVFSRADAGLDYFQHYARPVLRRWKTRGRVQHLVVDGAGHTFSPPEAQVVLRNVVVDFVGHQRWREQAAVTSATSTTRGTVSTRGAVA
jgi:alpha-beta hydrolase superfamily lysophospholipase